jgi:uncharacterized protein YggU (UPF0235/DUF167 family)
VSERVEIFQTGDGVRLRLRVKPGGRHQRLIGAYGGALKLEVSAAPEKGRANAAVIRLLSDALGLQRQRVEIVAGASSQDKVAVLTGCSVEEIMARLASVNIPAGKQSAGNTPVVRGG